jgi:hypothetical protein
MERDIAMDGNKGSSSVSIHLSALLEKKVIIRPCP